MASLKEPEERSSKIAAAAVGGDEQLRKAIDELRTHHEEVAVAEEELRAQLDELTQADLKLEHERESYVDLFDRAPSAYLVTDRFGVVRDANSAGTDLFGLEMRFLRGKPLTVFIVGSDGIKRFNDTLHALTKPKPPDATSSNRAPRSTVHLLLMMRTRGRCDHLEIDAHVSVTQGGHRLLWILRPQRSRSADDHQHGRDSRDGESDEKALQRKLRDKKDILEREQRLRGELERQILAKDQFLNALAQELRVPMSEVLGWTKLLRRERLDLHTRRETVATVERNAALGIDLLNRLLPLNVPHSSSASSSSSSPSPSSSSAVSMMSQGLQNLRVLVVEDDEDSTQLMATILRRLGADVITATGVRRAIESARRFTLDVVVIGLDAGTRGNDAALESVQLAMKLREHDASIVTVAMSTLPSTALDEAFDISMSKPIIVAELVTALQEARRLHRR